MTESRAPFDAYISALRESDIREKTEHTDRGALKALLGKFTAPGIKVVHEAKGIRGKGTPDFKVRHNGQILGYIEAKPLGADLNAVLKSDQIARYRSLSKNILLTNYLDWIWVHNDSIQKGTLCDEQELTSRRISLDKRLVERVEELLRGFVSVPPESISGAHDLANALAGRSRLLRDFLDEELHRQEREGQGERLDGLYAAFKKQVSENITLSEFSDAFAQTLSYGLFLSKLNANGHSLNLKNAEQYIPKSFKLIQELVSFLVVLDADSYRDVKWVVDEILSITNGINVASLKEDLSFKNRKGASRGLKAADEEEWRLFSRDPFIYFYEDFLAKYDPTLRKSRGIYYTPPPVVNFIVRAVDEILKEQFLLKDGLADHNKVNILEFACGTGTFIVEAIERIIDNLGSATGKIELVLQEHVLKNIYAFEYLIAPYTIAHLKLSQYFEDRQIRIGKEQRFNIFLTNTLEPLEPQHNFLLPALSDETKRALAIKKQPILVIMGNPPYSGHSLNKGEWITNEVRKYREGIPELSKPGQAKWLQDDYVKFFRFAQWKMERVSEGVVGIITNSAYLDNPTFRGMRKSLTETFNQIYIVDLHGNISKEEQASYGVVDENVFDIKRGVAIALLVKKPGAEKGVWRTDIRGRRLHKYKTLAVAEKSKIDWETLAPEEPLYLFVRRNEKLSAEFEAHWSIRDIFSPGGDPAPGVVTTHDQFAISFTSAEAIEKVGRLLGSRDEVAARRLFKLCSQSQWDYQTAKKELSAIDYRPLATRILYRPFDERWTIWNSNVAVHRRERAMKHMLLENIGLLTCRQVAGSKWEHVYISSQVTDDSVVSNKTKERGYIFPLYIYDHEFGEQRRMENFAPVFRDWLDERYGYHFEPEQVMGYIYAVLHSRYYRNRYVEFLKRDFPRIPFPDQRPDFEEQSRLGWSLINKHLLRETTNLGLADFCGAGSYEITGANYSSTDEAIYINSTQYFSRVPESVWSFRIGGYQVIDKVLKARKGRQLTLDEINKLTNVANALAFTNEQMSKIDKAYQSSFSA